MRAIEEREFWFHFSDTDEPKPTIEVSRTGLKKPITTVPTSLTIKWKKGSRFYGADIGWHDSGVWECVDVAIHANRVYPRSLKLYGHESVGIYYGTRSGSRPFDELPEWAAALVAKTFPGVTAALT